MKLRSWTSSTDRSPRLSTRIGKAEISIQPEPTRRKVSGCPAEPDRQPTSRGQALVRISAEPSAPQTITPSSRSSLATCVR